MECWLFEWITLFFFIHYYNLYKVSFKLRGKNKGNCYRISDFYFFGGVTGYLNGWVGKVPSCIYNRRNAFQVCKVKTPGQSKWSTAGGGLAAALGLDEVLTTMHCPTDQSQHRGQIKHWLPTFLWSDPIMP